MLLWDMGITRRGGLAAEREAPISRTGSIYIAGIATPRFVRVMWQ